LMHVHLVFVTKYRRNIFNKAILHDLKSIFESVCRDFQAKLTEFDGEKDHVYLLIEYPPKIAVSALVNSLKGVSSRLLQKKNYPEIKQALYGKSLWSPSYFAGTCGGSPLTIIKQYIERQNSPKA
jgi:putative transposase